MTVFVTRGRKYHLDSACHLMNGGEDLWDADGEDWSHTSGSYRRTVDTPKDASYLGKLPCLHCVTTTERVFPPLFGQTFGHKPVDKYDGTPEMEHGVTRVVCARCMIWSSWSDVGFWAGTAVAWPCTSAVILGIATAHTPDTEEAQ